MVDYVAARGGCTTFSIVPDVLHTLSDHVVLTCQLPFRAARHQCPPPHTTTVYRWVEGDSLATYASSWRTWERHTDNPDFAQRFSDVVAGKAHDVERCHDAVEQFLLQEALAAGVVRKVEWTQPTNPNKCAKQLAPWFNEECRAARKRYLAHVKRFGRRSEEAREKFKDYRACCDNVR